MNHDINIGDWVSFTRLGHYCIGQVLIITSMDVGWVGKVGTKYITTEGTIGASEVIECRKHVT